MSDIGGRQQRIAVRLVMALGFAASAVAYGAWTVQQTVLDMDATGEFASELLRTDAVQDALVEELEAQVGTTSAELGIDSSTTAALAAALEDPRFVDAFGEAVQAVHAQLLGGGDSRDGTITLDVAEVTAAVRDAVEPHDQVLAARISTQELRVDLGDADLPDLSAARATTGTVLLVAALLAAVLFAVAIVVHPDPRVAVGRIGLRLSLLTVGPFVVFLVLPWALGRFDGGAVEAAVNVLGVYRARVLPSAVLLAAGGIAIWVGARLWPRIASLDETPAATPSVPLDARPVGRISL